jgi:hypothetical protein
MKFCRLRRKQKRLIELILKTMKNLDDLNTAITACTQAVADAKARADALPGAIDLTDQVTAVDGVKATADTIAQLPPP